jgi:hypothetical protein
VLKVECLFLHCSRQDFESTNEIRQLQNMAHISRHAVVEEAELLFKIKEENIYLYGDIDDELCFVY